MGILSIIIAGILTENIVLKQSLGICPFLGVSKKMNSGIGMGLAVIFVITLSSLVCWVLYTYVLIPLGMEMLRTIVFILIIACLVQLLDIVLKKFSPTLYNSLGVYLALITTNCAVLGTANQVINSNYGILETFVHAVCIGIGFLLALILMSGVREKLRLSKIPKAFEGFAIALIIAAIMSMAFVGFNGFDLAKAIGGAI